MSETNITLPETTTAPKVGILRQYIKSLSFEADQMSISYGQKKENPDVQIKIATNADRIGDDKYEVDLIVSILAEGFSEDGKPVNLFKLDLAYSALLQPQNIDNEQIPSFLLIFIPNLIFPYARQIVSQITLEAGLPALLLDNVDFAQMYQDQIEANE